MSSLQRLPVILPGDMRNFGLLYDTIADNWFAEEPSRISWFLQLLASVDDDGVVEMSRAKYGSLFKSTPDAAFYFLKQLSKRKVVTLEQHARSTQVTICKIDDYDVVTRKLYANCTQTEDATRNLHANYTQVNDGKSECYDHFTRDLHATYTQTEDEQRTERRKETSLSPTPPITKEKNKEKKPLTRSCAPDFVGNASQISDKELEKQKKAEERKRKSEERKEKEKTLVTKARGVFEEYYRELYDADYYWQAKDAVAMKRLLQKITFGRTNRKTPLPCEDDDLLKALDVFLRMINKSWLMNNFSVNKIDGQYNEIVSEIKNKNNHVTRTTASTQNSTALLANQAANLLNDIAKADELYYRGEQGSDETS